MGAQSCIGMELTCTALGVVPIHRKHCCPLSELTSSGQDSRQRGGEKAADHCSSMLDAAVSTEQPTDIFWYWARDGSNFQPETTELLSPHTGSNFMPPVEPRFNPCVLPVKCKELTTLEHLTPVSFLLSELK